MITGSNGQLGKTLSNELKIISFLDIYSFDRKHLDITNFKKLDTIINKINPEVIINTAAYTDVNKAESEKKKCFDVNKMGPKNLSIIANKINACLIHFSTDFIFDGKLLNKYKNFCKICLTHGSNN